MSKLVDLLEKKTEYDRLNSISGHSPNSSSPKNFSVRNQSDVSKEVRQGNAVDFLDNKYQDGFKVEKPSLSVEGFQKSPGTQESDFTGTTTGTAGSNPNSAFDTYFRHTTDGLRTNYNSKLVHKYLATDMVKQYKTAYETSEGIKLVYTPA